MATSLKGLAINVLGNIKESINNTNSSSFQWQGSDLFQDPSNYYNYFFINFKLIYDDCFPFKTKNINTQVKTHKPWISPGIMTSIRKKNRLYKQWLKCKTDSALIKYKCYENKLTHIIRTAEKQFYSTKFYDLRNDLRGTWKLIKTVINRNATKNISEIKLGDTSSNNHTTTDLKGIAENVNNYFVNIGHNLAKAVPTQPGNYSDYIRVKGQSSMFIYPHSPVDETKVDKIMCSFSNNKASCYDEIAMKIVKEVLNHISRPLTNLFNLSFTTEIFPDKLKLAKVTPI